MRGVKQYWKKTWEYQRILEILDDYWLTEPDELAVYVQLDFIKADGQNQSKAILWMNPNYKRKKNSRYLSLKDFVKCAADLVSEEEPLYDEDHPFSWIDHKDYEKVISEENKP